ncbi:MAG: phosphoribosylglycinamide formyltransferase [Treponema sp.]|nr:phosphoribosylglycinamide formyltransferase [Treponema sp.]
MARYAVFASGNGGNFEALVEGLRGRHDCVVLVHDRRTAFAAERSRRLGVPTRYVRYAEKPRELAESEIEDELLRLRVDAIALAGFMRLLSPAFVALHAGRILNVHPSLLPAWPGSHSIARAFQAGERRFGVTVHLVDEGMDTGPILSQEAFVTDGSASLEEIEKRVHDIEHRIYPREASLFLDRLDASRRKA